MPRLLAVLCLAASLLAGAFALAPAVASAAAPPLGLPSGKPLLFAVQAERGSLVRVGRSRDRFVLTLRGVPSQGIWFTDRPGRDSGGMALGPFFSAWRALGFRADPPNAALALTDGRDRADMVVVELGAPRYDAGRATVSFRARKLGRASDGLDHLAADVDGSVPARFTRASLFIDDAMVGNSTTECNYMAQADLFPADVLPSAYITANGQLMRISQYNALYALLGSAFGGDEKTTFALPRLAGPAGTAYALCLNGLFPQRADSDYDGGAQCTIGSLSLQAQMFQAAGWVRADGRSLVAARQQALLATIGNAFGGDADSFNVPNVAAPPGLAYWICAEGIAWANGQPSAPTCFLSQLVPFASSSVPANYTPADGRTLPIRNNEPLYALIGNNFGGDGISTFQLPRLAGPGAGTQYGVCTEGMWPTRA